MIGIVFVGFGVKCKKCDREAWAAALEKNKDKKPVAPNRDPPHKVTYTVASKDKRKGVTDEQIEELKKVGSAVHSLDEFAGIEGLPTQEQLAAAGFAPVNADEL